MSNDSLGDRIKGYENVFRQQLVKRTPVMVRLDGKAFHSVTKNCDKPFDAKIMDAMVYAAKQVAEDIQGFKVGYIQSDEVSLVITDYDSLETQGWFGYNLNKIVSISASIMTYHFNSRWRWLHGAGKTPVEQIIVENSLPVAYFDSRAFNIPREEVSNAFKWRQDDWFRNSLQMFARSIFSHKELMNKNSSDIHEMLHNANKNWATDLSLKEKNGTFLIKTENGIEERSDITVEYENFSNILRKIKVL